MKSNLKTVRVTASETRYYQIDVNVPTTASKEDILKKIEPEDARVADKCSIWRWDDPCDVGFNPNANYIELENES